LTLISLSVLKRASNERRIFFLLNLSSLSIHNRFGFETLLIKTSKIVVFTLVRKELEFI
jgi:hypothetical protein